MPLFRLLMMQTGSVTSLTATSIRLYIGFIRKYDEEINSILESMHELVAANEDTDFVKQIRLIETFKGLVSCPLCPLWERLVIFCIFKTKTTFCLLWS